MIDLLGRLLPLWTQPVDSWDDVEAAFREVYADPVVVNGLEMPIVELVGRARALQQAFDGLGMHILDTVETPDRVVIAFLMRGRHVGPFTSPLGTVAPTQRDIEVRTIDVLSRRVLSLPSGSSPTTLACFASSMRRSWRKSKAVTTSRTSVCSKTAVHARPAA